jgi:hypothetical protein
MLSKKKLVLKMSEQLLPANVRWWETQTLSFAPAWGALLHTLLFMIFCWPLWHAEVLPFGDYLLHLSRMHILLEYTHSPALQEHYRINPDVIIPYKAMPTIVLPLARLTDLYTAGKLFVLLGLALTAIGVVALQITLTRRVNVLSTLVHPLLYSNVLAWGFITFTFSIGVLLCLFCGWLWTARWPWWARLLFLAVASTLLFFSHLLAVGFFAVLIGADVTAGERWFSRRFWRKGFSVIPGFLPAALLWLQVPDVPGLDKVTGRWLPFERFLVLGFDSVSVVHLAILGFFVIIIKIFRDFHDLTVPDAGVRRALWILLLIGILTPNLVLGIAFTDLRAPYLLCLLFIGTTSLQMSVAPPLRTAGIIVLVVLGSALIHRQFLISRNLTTCAEYLTELRTAVRTLPQGTAILPTGVLNSPLKCGLYSWHWNSVNLAVIERDAFVPAQAMGIFEVTASERNQKRDVFITSLTSMSMLSKTESKFFDSVFKNEILKHPERKRHLEEYRNFLENWISFPYIIDIDFGKPSKELPKELTAIQKGSFFTIYKFDLSLLRGS